MNPTTVTIGLDLGDRRHAVCVLDASGEILAEETIVNTRECLAVFAQRFPGATIVMETGTHSPWVSRSWPTRQRHRKAEPIKGERAEHRLVGLPARLLGYTGWKIQFPAGDNGCKLSPNEGRAERGQQPGTSLTCAAESRIHEQSLTRSGTRERPRRRHHEQEGRAGGRQASQPRGRTPAEDRQHAPAYDHAERAPFTGTLG